MLRKGLPVTVASAGYAWQALGLRWWARPPAAAADGTSEITSVSYVTDAHAQHSPWPLVLIALSPLHLMLQPCGQKQHRPGSGRTMWAALDAGSSTAGGAAT